MTRKVVLYHCPCPDGVFAALAAFLHFKNKGEGVTIVPHRVYEDLKFDFEPSDTVYLLDYIGPHGFLERLSHQVKSVVVLDHHKTAQEDIQQLTSTHKLASTVDVSRVTMEHSGCAIALAYFQEAGPVFSAGVDTKRLQRIFQLVEDGDLWKWKVKYSKEWAAGFKFLDLDLDVLKNPEIFAQLLHIDPDAVIAEGMRVHAEQEHIIEEEVATAFTVALGGVDDAGVPRFGSALAVLSKHPNLRSEMGNTLAQASRFKGLRAIGVIAYEEVEMADASKLKISLRSVGAEDTTVISRMYGGGGHLNASSFTLDKSVWDSWRVD